MRVKKYGIAVWALLAAVLLAACGDNTEIDMLSTGESMSQGVLLEEYPLEESPDGTAVSEETTEEEPEPEKVTITISAAGDVVLGNYLGQDYAWSFDQTYDQAEDKGFFFENVRDIFIEDDFTVVNLECILTTEETPRIEKTYMIKGKPEYAKLLPAAGIEAVSMGNNHRLDYGETASDQTRELLTEQGTVFAYDNLVGMYEAQGIPIGLISVNVLRYADGSAKLVEEGIESLRQDGAELILVCCHWGIEGDHYPDDNQKELGRKCIDLGADLVLGSHPHVLQGIEEYNGKFILYSMGNFCFGANRNPTDKDTMIFQQTFTFVDGEKQQDKEIRVIPCSVSSILERNDFRPTPARGDEAVRIINRINEFSSEMGVSFDENGRLQ